MDRPEILEQAATLADPTRSRILLSVAAQELTVSELCRVVQLPQSTVSRHLKQLRDQGWVGSRPEGTRRFYFGRLQDLQPESRRLWGLIRDGLGGTVSAASDRARLEEVLRQRRTRSEAFFDRTAADWDQLRQELFGERCDLLALPAFLDQNATIGDLGCGTGILSEILAPFTGRLIAVDTSAGMLEAARLRLAEHSNVEVRPGRLEALPIDDGELDVAALFLTLHHVADPRRVLVEAARAVKDGGKVVVVDMQVHDREEYQRDMGHVWMGFSREALSGLLSSTGFDGISYRPLPIDLAARGPGLFVAYSQRRHDVSLAFPSTPKQDQKLRHQGDRSP